MNRIKKHLESGETPEPNIHIISLDLGDIAKTMMLEEEKEKLYCIARDAFWLRVTERGLWIEVTPAPGQNAITDFAAKAFHGVIAELVETTLVQEQKLNTTIKSLIDSGDRKRADRISVLAFQRLNSIFAIAGRVTADAIAAPVLQDGSLGFEPYTVEPCNKEALINDALPHFIKAIAEMAKRNDRVIARIVKEKQ